MSEHTNVTASVCRSHGDRPQLSNTDTESES